MQASSPKHLSCHYSTNHAAEPFLFVMQATENHGNLLCCPKKIMEICYTAQRKSWKFVMLAKGKRMTITELMSL